jgi:3-phenylpropionate/trans-cinnamate dioxygenase ferredoxin reductase component
VQDSFDIVVIGAGHAGLAIIDRLRKNGFNGSIALIGDESHAPYQRPPLTKGYLQGEMSLDELSLGFDLAVLNVTFLSGVSATAIDRQARSLMLADGMRIGYRKLALATGSRPRRLPAPDDADILYLTTLSDCLRLQERLPSLERAVIIGGGFIGLEVAATLRKLGRAATVIEAQHRLLARSATTTLSHYIAALHRREGVDLRLGTAVERIEKGHVSLSDETVLPVDVIVAGIGSLANDDLAQQAGLACDNGILVDALAQTSDPDIVAAGDCTLHPNAHAPITPFRLESVQNACDQAVTAADTLLGQSNPYAALPTFWSDQFNARIAMAGISHGADEISIRGDPAEDSFSVFAFREGRLIAVESVNRPKDQRAARKLLPSEAITPDQARDETIDLATLAKQRQAA